MPQISWCTYLARDVSTISTTRGATQVVVSAVCQTVFESRYNQVPRLYNAVIKQPTRHFTGVDEAVLGILKVVMKKPVARMSTDSVGYLVDNN